MTARCSTPAVSRARRRIFQGRPRAAGGVSGVLTQIMDDLAVTVLAIINERGRFTLRDAGARPCGIVTTTSACA
jgi:hypothetical protein